MRACTDPLDTFLAFLAEMRLDAAAREAAYEAWVGEALPAFAEQLTEALPPDLRAAGIRYGWEAER